MAIVSALCAAYVIFCLVAMPAGPMTTPDSAHYLSFSPIVPLGYPAFLSLVGPRGAMFVQPILFAAALWWLGRETLRAAGSTLLAVLVVAASMALPQIVSFHASVLTESLFLSFLMVILALMIRFVVQPSWPSIAAIAVVIAVSATIRRTGYALLPVLILMLIQQRHRLPPRSGSGGKVSRAGIVFGAALIPFAAILGLEAFIASYVHGGQTSGLTGRHVFARAALIEAPAAAASGDALRDALNRQLQEAYAPIREVLERAPLDVTAVLAIYYETCLQGGCADGARALMPQWSEAQQSRAMGDAGMDRIISAPLGFARLTSVQFGSLWTIDRLHQPGTAQRLTRFIAANRPMPFEREALRVDPGSEMVFASAEYVRYAQPLFSGIAAFTGAIAVIGTIALLLRVRLSTEMSMAWLAALALHGGLLFTAMLAAGFSRFLIGLWPALVVATMLGAFALLRRHVWAPLP